jgi:hypothetical protein
MQKMANFAVVTCDFCTLWEWDLRNKPTHNNKKLIPIRLEQSWGKLVAIVKKLIVIIMWAIYLFIYLLIS